MFSVNPKKKPPPPDPHNFKKNKSFSIPYLQSLNKVFGIIGIKFSTTEYESFFTFKIKEEKFPLKKKINTFLTIIYKFLLDYLLK